MSRRRTAIAGGLAAGLAAGAVAGARRAYRGAVPRGRGAVTIPGLAGPVAIVRDTNGTPHIRAANQLDAIAALGVCHAQDRLFQMELIRRLVRGRLAELVGKEGLATDRYVRVLGLAASADVEAAAGDDEDRAFLAAYCRGVNAWIASSSYRAPLELRLLLHRRPAPWLAGDALLGSRFIALGLGQNWEGEIVRSRIVERLGADRLEQLEPGYPTAGYTSLPASAAAAVAAAITAKGRLGGPGSGSNNWVLAGSRTTTGKPILANDPHLLLGLPAVWYVADLDWGDGRAAGFTIPGTPAVVIGQSDRAAWGFTNVEADTQDLFAVDLETEPHEVRREEIRVRGRRAPHVEEVVTTRHGPVVTPLAPGERTAYALRWTALDPARSITAFRSLLTAGTPAALTAALEGLGGPILNGVWATVDGAIGYQMAGGPIPLRGRGDGRLPQDGADPAADWTGTIPYDELPRWQDPPGGTIITANNRIVDDAYPHLIATEWLNDYRAVRIASLLDALPAVSVDDCARIQVDIHSLPHAQLARIAARFTAAAPIERKALATLTAWDGTMAVDSAGAAVAATLLRHLTREAYAEVGDQIDHFLGSAGFSELSGCLEFFGRTTPVVLDRLEADDDGWFRDGRTWVGVFAKSLTRTCVELESRAGDDVTRWAWGDLHALVLDHPLAAIPGLDRVFRRGPYPLPGDADTVWAAWQPPGDPWSGTRTSGPSMRFIADLADPDNTRIVLCGGQSGHPASDGYDDHLTDWLLGRTRRLHWSAAAIEANRAATLELQPG
jgi:penicillin amidase